MSKKLWRHPAIVASALCVILVACAHQTPSAAIKTAAAPPANTACTAFAPITFSRLHDTPETIVAVKAHNAAYLAICPAR